MTGANFLTYVKAIFKRTDKDTQIYQAMTDTVMDIRLRSKSEDYKEEAYTSLLSLGSFKISMPDDFGHLIGDVTLYDSENETTFPPLRRISKERYDELYFDRLADTVSNRVTGLPVHYCIYGNEIFIGPCVDKATYKFQMNYTTESAEEISSSTDPVPFTERYRWIVRCGVLKHLYLMLENFQEAEVWSNLYEAEIVKIIGNDESNVYTPFNLNYNGV